MGRMKQYPYEITYKLNTTGNKRFTKRVEASHQGEAKKLFEAEMPLQLSSALLLFHKTNDETHSLHFEGLSLWTL